MLDLLPQANKCLTYYHRVDPLPAIEVGPSPQDNFLNLYAWEKPNRSHKYCRTIKSNTHDTNFYKNTSHGDVVSEGKEKFWSREVLSKCIRSLPFYSHISSGSKSSVIILLHGPHATGVPCWCNKLIARTCFCKREASHWHSWCKMARYRVHMPRKIQTESHPLSH